MYEDVGRKTVHEGGAHAQLEDAAGVGNVLAAARTMHREAEKHVSLTQAVRRVCQPVVGFLLIVRRNNEL